MDGKTSLLFSDGNREEYEFKDGKINGKYISYANDGMGVVKQQFRDGKLHGRRRV